MSRWKAAETLTVARELARIDRLSHPADRHGSFIDISSAEGPASRSREEGELASYSRSDRWYDLALLASLGIDANRTTQTSVTLSNGAQLLGHLSLEGH